jgi:uridine kinase
MLLAFDQVAEILNNRLREVDLIAIDGLPCAGKSTLATYLSRRFGLPVLGFDAFYLPEESWATDIAPCTPFPFFRMREFYEAVRDLKIAGRCRYRPYDWAIGAISAGAIEMHRNGPLIVEGCSVLEATIAPFYDLKIFVESNAATLMEALRERDGELDSPNWQRLYLPSVDLYMQTTPRHRADVAVTGRGIG